MASKLSSLYEYGTLRSLLSNIGNVPRSKAHKRWRIACLMICFSITLSKQMLSRKAKYQQFWNFGSTSSTVIDIVTYFDEQSRSPDSTAVPVPITNHANAPSLTNVDAKSLTDLVKNRNLEALEGFGKVKGLAKILGTHLENGIKGDDSDINARRDTFGSNTYQKPPPIGILHFVIEAFSDTTILILLGCAALSLGFGIREYGAQDGWYEGGSIIVAVFLVVVVSAGSNFRQERQFEKLSKISDNIQIEAVRNGRRQKVSIFDILVGDIVSLKIGDQIPADGLFIDGHSLQVDEASMTGESDHVQVDSLHNPFLFSGSKVADGYARMLVISVGTNTSWGDMMSSITRNSQEETPLQLRLNKLTSSIGKVGLAVAFLVLIVLLIRYFTGNTEDANGNTEYQGAMTSINDIFNSILRIISVAVTILVVAIPEGLPLAVTLTLAYSMKRMMADQAMVRKLSACETMGSATVICTDKTGTLTLNQMKVTKFWLGDGEIGERYDDLIPDEFLDLLYQGIGLNTTGSIYKPKSGSAPEISGSPTEKAILSWAVQDLGMEMDTLKLNYSILHVNTFNSEKKRSGVLTRRKGDNTHHVHWKGAAEILLSMCSSYYQINGYLKTIDEDERTQLEKIIQGMAASSLRCIAFAHKQITKEEMQQNENQRKHEKLKEDDLTLL